MIRSLKAIIRWSVPGHPALAPGTLVLTSHLAFDPPPGRRFPATLQAQLGPIFWLPAEYLLPHSKFLRRQPRSEFWMLALKERLQGGHPEPFLSDPIKQTLSSKAFRFESIGELIFYLSYHQLDPHKFNACFVADIGVA